MTAIDLGSTGLRATKADGVLRVVLDRPERKNACTVEMYHGIKKAAVLAERDPDVDVLVLTGSGDTFCVGGEMGGKHEGGQALDRETDGLDLTPFVQLERCPKIVLVAINGMCQGGGLVMTLMSDVSVVSDRATFRVPELLRGVADCYLGARLASRVGMARAKYLLFTAQYFSAAEALAMGLVNAVVPAAELRAETEKWCREILAKSPTALKLAKQSFNADTEHIAGVTEVAFSALELYYATDEAKEGRNAFMEKRPPRFRGR
jgi:1,4-dihydroxy-2-naphthoyl-CoA synthase